MGTLKIVSPVADKNMQDMRNFIKTIPTVVILGPTGSGKTAVGVEAARAVGGEVISADSGAVYRGMDIGTAKPTLEERQGVPHWGIDLVEPDERFTVADWKEYAAAKLEEIRGRGKVPIIVGGTGLYIDALVYDYQWTEEAKKSQSDRRDICINYLLIGVQTTSVELRKRLRERVDKLFVQELFDETRELVEKYGEMEARRGDLPAKKENSVAEDDGSVAESDGSVVKSGRERAKGEGWGMRSMKNNIYRFAWQYLQGEITLEEAKKLNFYADWHLAKRQMTWFKRNKNIHWLPLEEIKGFVMDELNKSSNNDRTE